MPIILINPNSTEAMTRTALKAARDVSRPAVQGPLDMQGAAGVIKPGGVWEGLRRLWSGQLWPGQSPLRTL